MINYIQISSPDRMVDFQQSISFAKDVVHIDLPLNKIKLKLKKKIFNDEFKWETVYLGEFFLCRYNNYFIPEKTHNFEKQIFAWSVKYKYIKCVRDEYMLSITVQTNGKKYVQIISLVNQSFWN